MPNSENRALAAQPSYIGADPDQNLPALGELRDVRQPTNVQLLPTASLRRLTCPGAGGFEAGRRCGHRRRGAAE